MIFLMWCWLVTDVGILQLLYLFCTVWFVFYVVFFVLWIGWSIVMIILVFTFAVLAISWWLIWIRSIRIDWICLSYCGFCGTFVETVFAYFWFCVFRNSYRFAFYFWEVLVDNCIFVYWSFCFLVFIWSVLISVCFLEVFLYVSVCVGVFLCMFEFVFELVPELSKCFWCLFESFAVHQTHYSSHSNIVNIGDFCF